MASVKVAVRVRPFNQREIDLNSVLCINMNGATTSLTDPEDGKVRDFTFDYSFWSHDQFHIDDKGYFVPDSDKYADQRKVFETVGLEILDNAWQGYHCCLFAYGQTGAGKSYSMIGYGANRGIVPISMEEIFDRIKKFQNEGEQFEVMFSMQEIYNEKIQDLLVATKDRPPGGLKVREHQKMGVYVDGLSKWPVDSYEAIDAKMDEGNRNRTIGSTIMNASSSRAHTIITIEFKKIEMINGKKTEKFSIINLVDLAGSEKLAKTGATGDRMKEGCAINQSLTSLGIVISKLAEKAQGKKNIVIPYRDSVLTRILQNALGGNSKTLMICALSPATDNFDETLSTLRYADQAKKIKNNAVINESEQDKMIRELKEENEKLKSILKDFATSDLKNIIGGLSDEERLKRYKDVEDQLNSNQCLVVDMEKTFAEKLKESKMKEKEEEMVNKLKPHLLNLNEDPLLSAKVLYSLDKAVVYVGRKNGNPMPNIILGGAGIKPNHAKITNEKGNIFVEAIDEECAEYIFLNGEKLSTKKKLQHNDRLIFGTNAIFLFKNPLEAKQSPNAYLNENELDWEFAQKELVDTMNKLKQMQIEQNENERQVQVELRIKQVQELYKREKESIESAIKQQQDEYEKKIKELEQKMKKETEAQLLELAKRETEREWKEAYARYEAERLQKERERERIQKEIQEESVIKKIREQEKDYLERALTKFLSKITEVNLIAKELKRNINFSIKLSYSYISGTELTTYSEIEKSQKLKILVDNKEQNCRYEWKLSKFSNRYYIIKDVVEKFYETGILPITNNINDPFWDPPEPNLIGQAFISLQPIIYLIDNSAELTLVGDNGECGTISVALIPTDKNGEPLGEDSDYIEDPHELVDKRFDFKVQLDYVQLTDNASQDTYCEYILMDNEGNMTDYRTPTITGKVSKPEYNYIYQHTYKALNQKLISFFSENHLNIRVYGYEILEENKENYLAPEKTLFLANPTQVYPNENLEQKPKKPNAESAVEESSSSSSRVNPNYNQNINLMDPSQNQNQNQNQSNTTNPPQTGPKKRSTTADKRNDNPVNNKLPTGKSQRMIGATAMNLPPTLQTDLAYKKKKEDCNIF